MSDHYVTPNLIWDLESVGLSKAFFAGITVLEA